MEKKERVEGKKRREKIDEVEKEQGQREERKIHVSLIAC